MRNAALKFIYTEKRKAKQSLGQAENRPGVKQEELDNLRQRIEVLEWLEPIVLKEEE